MQIQEVMSTNPETIDPNSTLLDCARKMKENDVGMMPVVEGNIPIGIITDRDIVIRGIAAGLNPQQTKVSDCMSREVRVCFLDDDIQQAAKLMQQKQIRRLLVLDRDDQQLVGVVSLGDLAIQVHQKQISEKTLERVSQPSETRRKKVA
jgi:CBS domain-containing protein